MEKKIGLIPKVIIQGLAGPKEYGLLMTDIRSIFVLERETKANVGAVIGGAVGALATSLLSQKKTIDYAHDDVEHFAQNKENIVVLYSQIQKIDIKKPLGGYYTLYLEYTDATTGNLKKIKAVLYPPEELLIQKKNEGMKAKDIIQDYVKKSKEAFQQVLPQSLLINSEWAT